MGNKLIECVPNYSEGRDLEKIEKIVVNCAYFTQKLCNKRRKM